MAAAEDARGAATHARRLRALVAEDDESSRTLAERLLAACDVDTVAVSTDTEALAAWERGGFDLILMDMLMPHMDVIAATRAIRGREKARTTRTTIVALTAAPSADEARCLAAGMDALISKPLRIDVLRDVVALAQGRAGTVAPREPHASAAEVFDLERALKAVDGERELLEGMIGIFMRQTPRVMQDIDKALAARDAEALEGAAHKLKGSVAVFGAHAARDAAQRLEALAAARELAAAASARDDLARQIERLETALAAVGQAPR
jgi:CheY-like chemotaxis protein